MSPEQAGGKAVDRRSDIWAFGSILYEMLTGGRAFPGETISDTLAAVLTSEPDWSAIPPATPSRYLPAPELDVSSSHSITAASRIFTRSARDRMVAGCFLPCITPKERTRSTPTSMENEKRFCVCRVRRCALRSTRLRVTCSTRVKRSLGADGTLAVLRPSELPSEIVSLDRTGSLTTIGKLQAHLLAGLAPWPTLALSPDGERLAVVLAQPGGGELWSYDLRSSKTTRLSVGAQVVLRPQWVPDGSRVIMAALVGTPAWNLFVVPSTTTSRPEPLLPSTGAIRWPCTISPDGKLLVFGQRSATTIDLWQMTLDGTAPPTPLIATPTANETDATFSPDGRRLAYTSDQTGRTEVYLRAFPLGTEGSEIVSNEGGYAPMWSRDGRMILFRSGNRVMAVTLGVAGSKTTLSPPTQLFSIPADARLDLSFAVSPDAGRLLLVRAMGDDHVSVVLNWTARLRRIEER